MKNGQVRVITAASRKRRIIYLVPIFLCAVVIGFFLDLSTYEVVNLDEIRLAFRKFPQRWNRRPPEYYTPPNFDDYYDGADSGEENTTKPTLPLWKQPNLLNLQNFTWLINNESLCRLDTEVQSSMSTRLMPVLVHTARDHFEERVAIRKSWGSVPIYKKWDVRLVFLMGEADPGKNPKENQKQLITEQELYGDLVIGSFVDTYHNLTYKHLMGYKWILNFCPNATFVLKVDDDMFIDILKWLDWRTEDLEKLEKDNSTINPDLYCNTFEETSPFRRNDSKWYVSWEVWPEKYYPPYCSGWAYGISVRMIKTLYSVSNDFPFYWIDDVFVTGILLEIAQRKYHFEPEYHHIWGHVTSSNDKYRVHCDTGRWDSKRDFREVTWVQRGNLFERDMMCLWNKTVVDSTYNFTMS